MTAGRRPDWDDLVLVGVIARTHGLRGELVVNPVTDFVEKRFAEGAVLEARRPGGKETETLTIASVRFQLGRPIVGMAGIDSVEAAEGFAGAELRVSPDVQQALPEGVYYHSQLVGCEVVTEAGETVGTVSAVEGETANSRLVVKGRRAEVLIPLVDAICPRVDVEARRIVVRPPEGLLELNEKRFPAGEPERSRPEAGPGGA